MANVLLFRQFCFIELSGNGGGGGLLCFFFGFFLINCVRPVNTECTIDKTTMFNDVFLESPNQKKEKYDPAYQPTSEDNHKFVYSQ